MNVFNGVLLLASGVPCLVASVWMLWCSRRRDELAVAIGAFLLCLAEVLGGVLLLTS